MPKMTLELLIARNRNWATHSRNSDPSYFSRHKEGQTPQCLWISCADSRVPTESLVQASPGELFVLRNIANQVLQEDDGMMSGVYYALTILNINMVVVCGHTGCGGVAFAGQQATVTQKSLLVATTSLHRQLASLSHVYREQLARNPDWLRRPPAQLQKMLVEINVRQQVLQLRNTAVFQEINRQRPISLHGCIYDLAQGRLRLLSDDENGEAV